MIDWLENELLHLKIEWFGEMGKYKMSNSNCRVSGKNLLFGLSKQDSLCDNFVEKN